MRHHRTHFSQPDDNRHLQTVDEDVRLALKYRTGSQRNEKGGDTQDDEAVWGEDRSWEELDRVL